MRKGTAERQASAADNLFQIDQSELDVFALPSRLSAASIIPRDAKAKRTKIPSQNVVSNTNTKKGI